MISWKHILAIVVSSAIVFGGALLVAALFGPGSRGNLKTMFFVAPALFLVAGWFWSTRSTRKEQLIAVLLIAVLTYLGVGYFSGSYVPSSFLLDWFVPVALLLAVPFLAGATLPGILGKLRGQ